MTSWFSSAGAALDGQIARATSSSLEDIALNLEISDTVRCRAVPAKDAMRSMKRRLDNKNPNVQLAALNLIDTCVKNGGTHFFVEIASREFMDNLVSLLKAEGSVAINQEVKDKILELIQIWSYAAKSNSNLSYINDVYSILRKENFKFPPAREVTSSLFDSSAPPDWVDSEVCMKCRTPFTFTVRKHHCRNCGCVFCKLCSSKILPLPHLGIKDPVRVDDGCYDKLTNRVKSTLAVNPSSTSKPTVSTIDDDEDSDSFKLDLKRALELSIEDTKSNQFRKNYHTELTSSNSLTFNSVDNQPANGDKIGDDDFDDEMKLAIAASLAEFDKKPVEPAVSNPVPAFSINPKIFRPSAPLLPANDVELTPAEMETINLFYTLVERQRNQPTRNVLCEPQLQELYEVVERLKPKLVRTSGEILRKYSQLLGLHIKLTLVVQNYERLLEDKFRNTLGQVPVKSNPAVNLPADAASFYQTPYPIHSSAATPTITPNSQSLTYTSTKNIPTTVPTYTDLSTSHSNQVSENHSSCEINSSTLIDEPLIDL